MPNKDQEVLLDEVSLEGSSFIPVEESEDVVFDEATNDETTENFTPYSFTKDWTDYIISFLNEDELDDGKPRCDGLKRLSKELLGEHKPELIVHAINQGYAAVTYKATFKKGVYIGSAECHAGNTDSPFSSYPLATAETRAISRALKNALGLKVITAEETSRKAELSTPANDENRTEGGITTTQVKFIERTCKNLDLSVKDVVEATIGQVDNIEELSHGNALKINQVLDEWKRGDNVEGKPTKVYDENWRLYYTKR